VVEILEQGAVSFVAVPRAGRDPHGAEDLARFFVVLAPEGRRPLRRLAVRRRRLPDERRAQRFFAHVDRIAPVPARLTDDVRARGAAVGAALAARVLAVGRYALARHGGHVHLAYALARACGLGRLAAALGIAAGASFVLCVFRRSLPPTRRPHAREPLAAATPDRLDVIGAEVALVAGARPDDARLGVAGAARVDRVGEALVGALLRRGPRPRVASFVRAAPPPSARGSTRRGEPATRPARRRRLHVRGGP
jgi:hypothetical protein